MPDIRAPAIESGEIWIGKRTRPSLVRIDSPGDRKSYPAQGSSQPDGYQSDASVYVRVVKASRKDHSLSPESME
jgi:hypothetical protein